MEINFGTTSSNVIRAELFAWILLACSYFALVIQNVLDNAHESVLHSSMANLTSIKTGFFCGIPYDACRCSVQSTKNEDLKYCLTDNFLLGSRIFLLVSYVMQICLLRDLFSFTGKYIRFLVYILWITSIYIFAIITNGIYQGSCFHRSISGVFCITGGLLFFFFFYDMIFLKDIDYSPYSDNTIDDEIVEIIDDDPICWRELL